MEVCSDIYTITKDFPDNEKFGLTSQIRRSAVSIPSNIAEGASRKSNRDFCRFLEISQGSGFELQTQLIIAKATGYISEEQHQIVDDKLTLLLKMIYKLKSRN